MMNVDGIVDSDLTFDLQVLAWYFKEESTYSDRFDVNQLKPDTIVLSRGHFSNHTYVF